MYLDACLQGMGAIFNDLIYNVPTPEILKGAPIATHEMFNILVAIRMFAKNLHHKMINVFCDNAAVVTILKSGKTKDPLLATITRYIFMEVAQLDIFLKFSHISGVSNTISDLLSRWKNTDAQIKQLYKLDH